MTVPITQEITTFDTDLPDKDSMTPDEFNIAAELFVEYLGGLADELNEFADQMNQVANDGNDVSAALAAANFKGAWDDLTGALNIPACVYHEDVYWILLTNLANVATSEPSFTNTDWASFPTGLNVIYLAGGGALLGYKTYLITDSGTYTLPAADSMEEGGWVDVMCSDDNLAETPTVQRAGSDVIVDSDSGSNTSVVFNQQCAICVRFITNGDDEWYLVF